MPTLSLLRKVSICALILPLATPVQSAEVATIVVSSVAGGPLDVLGRMLAREATETTGQTIVVENRAGAAGTIAAEAVGRAKPDGNTLLLTLDTVATANPHIYVNSKFKIGESLDLVSLLGTFDQVLVVPSKTGITKRSSRSRTPSSRNAVCSFGPPTIQVSPAVWASSWASSTRGPDHAVASPSTVSSCDDVTTRPRLPA